jgi:hypothetical protein
MLQRNNCVASIFNVKQTCNRVIVSSVLMALLSQPILTYSAPIRIAPKTTMLPTVVMQDPLGGIALGAALNLFASRVKEAIEKAIGGGLILEINAGGQVATLIDQAKAAYQNQLQLTFAQLDATQQNAINSLKSVVDDFVNKTYSDLKDLENRAAGIAHVLPFSKNYPQVFSFGPSFVDQNRTSGAVRVTIEGDFIDATRPTYAPVMTIGGQHIKPSVKTNQLLGFDVPMTVLSKAADKISYNTLSVDIPYKQSFFGFKKHTNFQIPIVILPARFGTITVVTTSTKPGLETKEVTGPQDRQESSDDDIKCGGEHADLAIHKASPDSGWRVRPNTVHYIFYQNPQGSSWTQPSNCSTQVVACLCWSTEHHGLGTSDKVYFQIVFTEERDTVETNSSSAIINLNWGDSKVFQIPQGATWKGTYTEFDGKTIEFAGSFQNPYLKVSQNGTTINFSTVP